MSNDSAGSVAEPVLRTDFERGQSHQGDEALKYADVRSESPALNDVPAPTHGTTPSAAPPAGTPPLTATHDGDTTVELSWPMPPPDPEVVQRFEEKVASSSLASTSTGLLALLRDHPELVSEELAKEAARTLPKEEVLAPKVAAVAASYPGTPHDEDNVQSTVYPDTNEERPTYERSRSSSRFALPEKALAALHQLGESAINVSAVRHSSTGAVMSRPGGGSGANLGTSSAKPDYSGERIVVAMVGLPARGKSYLSNKLMRYLRWREYKVQVFNVGQLRRAVARDHARHGEPHQPHTADFFDANNVEAKKLRNRLAHQCLEELIHWLQHGGGNVGILDATNTTKARRKLLADRVAQEPGLRLVFIESICTDPKVIAENIAVKVNSSDPDYSSVSREQAKRDFMKRIENYEAVYEPLDEDGTEGAYSYCKVVDVGRTTTMNLINSYLESQMALYLLNLHVKPRNIFISRHGESQYNVEGKIGGDADLSERGWAYARALPKLIRDNIGDEPLTVWTSSLRRTGQTASFLPYPRLVWNSLDELDAGVCDGMTYEEIERFFPEDYASRDDDKFNYRYRGGESYRDLVHRLEPVIMELERQTNILIIGHQAVIRALYAYFMGYDQNDLPYIKVPLHTVIKLTPKAYGCDEERYALPIEAVDTHRARPERAAPREPSEPHDADSAALQAMTAPPPTQQRDSPH